MASLEGHEHLQIRFSFVDFGVLAQSIGLFSVADR